VPTTTSPPPPPSGNTKYIALGVLLLLAGAAVWFLLFKTKPPAPPPAPAKPSDDVARVNPMAQPDLELEEPKDAGSPKTAEPEKKVVHRGPAPGEWECSGDLPGAAKVVQDNSAQVRSCYERRLKMDNALQGDLKLRLKIGANGKVVLSSVTGSLHDNEVFNCVRNLAQTWTFGMPRDGSCAVVSVPFQFSPKP
jgi:hypothetical protein